MEKIRIIVINNVLIFQNKNFLLIQFILLGFTLLALGMIVQFSAANGNIAPFMRHQFFIVLISLPIVIFILLQGATDFQKYAYIIYIISLFLLSFVNIFGDAHMGARRWIKIFNINLQPSEFFQVSLILFIAKYYSRLGINEIEKISYLIIPILAIIIPVIMILYQPNLGNAIMILLICLSIFFYLGIQIWKFLFVGFITILCVPLIWKYALHAYQKKRIFTFLNPETDYLNSGYNILQSKIAIGSAGVYGKGFVQGTQTQLKFLPEKHTDFVFAVFAEEFGFLLSATLIILYLIFLITPMIYSLYIKNMFNKIILIGVSSYFFFHLFINIGMVMGILPVVGVPLPLISYGGSNLLTSIVLISLVINIMLKKDQ